jgi:hypothetical protein
VKNASETYGATMLGGTLHAARVENDGARNVVTRLMTSEDNVNGDTLDSGRLFFGVDGSLAVVKKIQIKKNPSADAIETARFELAQSLLDPPDSFYFDIIPLNGREGFQRFLSIAYHKAEINRLIESYQATLRKPSGFKLHAAALADGYLTFCRREPGDLQVLIDVEADTITLAIIYRDKLYGAACLESAPGDTISSAMARKLAAEFKLMLSFDLAELFQAGITVPVSRIVLSGRYAADELLITALRERFSMPIVQPQFNEGYFQPASETIDRYPPERFLIPLGLALE